MHNGSCLCGAVGITVKGELAPPDACHCTKCRKQSGHFWCSTDVPRAALTVRGNDNISWFQSSERVRRGFCSVCGSTLFWDPKGRDKIAVSMGVFEAPTGTQLALHIFVADKGDYYTLGDGVPQNEQ